MYFSLNLNTDFVTEISNFINIENKIFQNENIFNLINQRLLFILNEKIGSNLILDKTFEIIEYTKDGFTEVTEDDNSYILLLGLTPSNGYDGGKNVLWQPLNDENEDDFKRLQETDDEYICRDIFKKYNISFYSKNNLFEIRERIISIGCIPLLFTTLKMSRALFFNSNYSISGESMCNWEKPRYILKVKLHKNIELEEIYNQIKIFKNYSDFLNEKKDSKSEVPFYILLSKGEYNDNKFNDRYFTLHLNEDYLQKIYRLTKEKLNRKYREDHLDSKIIEEKTENKLKDLDVENIEEYEEWMYQVIENYFLNQTLQKDEVDIYHYENVENTWEEKRGKPYEEMTELHCKISVLWGTLKN